MEVLVGGSHEPEAEAAAMEPWAWPRQGSLSADLLVLREEVLTHLLLGEAQWVGLLPLGPLHSELSLPLRRGSWGHKLAGRVSSEPSLTISSVREKSVLTQVQALVALSWLSEATSVPESQWLLQQVLRWVFISITEVGLHTFILIWRVISDLGLLALCVDHTLWSLPGSVLCLRQQLSGAAPF
jgi:hypothetical protein